MHLAWAHTLVAPLTEPRPAPRARGWKWAAPKMRADALNILPYNGLAAWESWTGPERGSNIRAMVERYAAGPETSHAKPPGRGTLSVVSMVVFKDGQYYQVRITPWLLAPRLDLEAVDSMLLRDPALPDGPSTLYPDQRLDPLTATMSGRAGSWHQGHTLYCLRRWAQRRWPHTREWSAVWRLHLEGQQHAKVILAHARVKPPTTANLCPVCVIYQIRALATGQVPPTIHTEAKARGAHAALVSELFDVLRTALIRDPDNPPMP